MVKKDAAAIILGAGQGTRMGKKHNKLLLPLGMRTIVEVILDRFLYHGGISKIFLSVSSKDRRNFEKILPEQIVLVEGGERRQDSVHNALLRIMQEKKVPEIVLIHDGARPFCSIDLIDRVLESTINHDAAIPVLPVVDTIRILDNEKTEILDRDKLFSVQTPQGFKTELIAKASIQAISNNLEVTDDAALIENIGGEVKTVEGEYQNFKITTPDDLERANYILNSKDSF